MGRRCRPAPGEVHDLVRVDSVDADPPSHGSCPHEDGDPLRALRGRSVGFGFGAHVVDERDVVHRVERTAGVRRAKV
jgi:hypothetical protein